MSTEDRAARASTGRYLLLVTLVEIMVFGLGISPVAAQQVPPAQDRPEPILTIDHFVPHLSSIPAIAGQTVNLYVRERAQPSTILQRRAAPGSVVLFLHGGTATSEVAFDVPYEGYSWMAYLARAGFDVFAMDNIGYGPSTRPAVMADPCNASAAEQAMLIPTMLAGPCPPSYGFRLGSNSTDWEEIDQVVDYLRTLRQVDRISLIGWSSGASRAGGFAAQHPEKVASLVVLATGGGYDRSAQSDAPIPAPGAPMTIVPREVLMGNWDRQGQRGNCVDQVDSAIRDTIWAQSLGSDPTGSRWGPGVFRAPVYSTGGFTEAVVAKMHAPTLIIFGEFDRGGAGTGDINVAGEARRNLFADLGATSKVLLEVACASHYALWETSYPILHQASLDWLQNGSINGVTRGSLRVGD
jgi:pimeloyl-ACP methyl ester carboxylesterase